MGAPVGNLSMTQMLLALGRAECVWSPLLPGDSQAVRVALYAKDLYFVFFSLLFLYRGHISFLFFPHLYNLSQEMAASRSLFGLEKGSQYLVVARVACARKFYVLNFLLKTINTSLVFNHKWERYDLVVTQFFEDHHDVFLERPSNAL